jgi:hypothetical protein
MRSWPLIIALLGAGCVDLTRPPELTAAPDAPGADDAALVDPSDVTGPNGPEAAAPDEGSPGETTPPPPEAGRDAMGSDAPSSDAPSSDALPPDTARPDLGLAADAPVVPDAAAGPDQAPDLAADQSPDSPADRSAEPARDLAPDLSPDLAQDLAPDLPPDVGAADTGVPVLVVDDFQAAVTTRNNLGSEVTWDHENCTRVGGESVCVYAGSGGFHDFIETFDNWCSFDVRAYTKVRFRLRTSLAGELVDVFAGINSGALLCTDTSFKLGTITTTTTMTTYTFDLTALAQTYWLTRIELDPRSTSASQFILDDLQLVP